jgi:hypothetical protein
MAQTVQLVRSTTNTTPALLPPGALKVELGTYTRLWVGAPGANRLLLSNQPGDTAIGGGGGGSGTITGVTAGNGLTGGGTTGTVALAVTYSGTLPAMDGTAAAGTAVTVSRSDHIHPTDTSRYAATNPSGYQTASQVTTALAPYAPLASPALTGSPTAPTVSPGTDNSTKVATTAFVQSAVAAVSSGVTTITAGNGLTGGGSGAVTLAASYSVSAPVMDGTATAGVAITLARTDHVHPTDTTRYASSNPSGYQTAANVTTSLAPYAPLASPTFTGAPAAPTASANDNTTKLATTAYVIGQASGTTPLIDGTAAAGSALVWARGDHVHPTDTSRYAATNPSGYQTAAQVTAAVPVASSTTPVMDGTAAVGTGTTWARADHVHATDTSRYAATNPSGYQTAAQVAAAVVAGTGTPVAFGIDFSQGAVVVNGTITVIAKAPFALTINSMDYRVGSAGGSFTVAVQIAGVSVTGLSAVVVSSATSSNAAATAANTVTAGQAITVVISATSGSPTGGNLQINGTR